MLFDSCPFKTSLIVPFVAVLQLHLVSNELFAGYGMQYPNITSENWRKFDILANDTSEVVKNASEKANIMLIIGDICDIQVFLKQAINQSMSGTVQM